MKLLNIILCLILVTTNSFADILKIKGEDCIWNVTIDTSKVNKIFVPRVGNVIFQTLDVKTIKWSSDFNEGVIDIFSGKSRITKDKYSGELLGDEFNCLIFSRWLILLEASKLFLKLMVSKVLKFNLKIVG